MLEILVVDDDPGIRHMYGQAVLQSVRADAWAEKLGYPGPVMVTEAATCREAVRLLTERGPGVLIVDLKIDGCAGEEFGGMTVIKESLRLEPYRPIVVITGYGSDVRLYREAGERGVFEFLEKSANSPRLVIEAVRRALQLREEALIRIGNPFTRSQNDEPAVFGGRDAELGVFDKLMRRALEKGTCDHFSVIGGWGLGKTTLLREYKRISQARGIPASIVPLEPLGRNATTALALRSMVEGALRGLPMTRQRLRKLVDGLEGVGLSVLGSGVQFTRSKQRSELPPQALLHDVLLSLWNELRQDSPLVLILLDDLDNFASVPEAVLALKQTLSMEAIRETGLVFGVTATPRFWNRLTQRERHHPLARYFLPRITLNPLRRDEFHDTITRSAATVGVQFDDDVVQRAYAYTGGHPFEMQVLCYHLFDNQISRRVGAAAWEQALGATLDDMGMAIFDNWLSNLSADELHVLRIAARAGGALSAREVHTRAADHGIVLDPEAVSRSLQRLTTGGILTRVERGLYSIPDPMFVAYLNTRVAPHVSPRADRQYIISD